MRSNGEPDSKPILGILNRRTDCAMIPIWNFRLDADDMSFIAALDQRRCKVTNHSSAETAKFLSNFKIHK